MAKFSRNHTNPLFEEARNPFETVDNSAMLRKSLDEIDNKSIRAKFKNTEDPILIAFEAIENTPLDKLALDLVKDSFYDIVSFITNICK